jgi:hypothetical protein
MVGRRLPRLALPKTGARNLGHQADEMMYLVKNTSRDNIGIAQRGVMK